MKLKLKFNKSDGQFVAAMLTIACLYKIAVVKNGLIHSLLLPLVNILPLSEVSRYTNTISIVKMHLPVLVLQFVCVFVWLHRKKWKLKRFRNPNALALLAIFIVRFISELYSHKGSLSIYTLGYDVICLLFVIIIYQFKTDGEHHEKLQSRIVMCVFRIAFVCSLFALANFAVGLGLNFSAFRFRNYRIGGFIFDAILAGFIYGVGLLSAFELYKRHMIKPWLLIVSMSLFVIGDLLTGSRSSIYFLVMAVWYYICNKKGYTRFLVVALFLVMGAALYFNLLSNESISFVSDGPRSYKYALAFKVFRENSIIGVGTNMFHNYDVIFGSNPHNLPLTILAENGIIGFIPYAIWIVINIYNMVRTKSMFWRLFNICFMLLSMILGTLTNMITVLIMIIASWGCDVSKEPAYK